MDIVILSCGYLKLLSILKLVRVSHIHRADLYLQLVVTILASFLPFF